MTGPSDTTPPPDQPDVPATDQPVTPAPPPDQPDVPATDQPVTRAPRPDPLRQRAISGVVWTTVQKWTVRLSTLVGFVILGNLLSPLEFGVVALAMSFINLLTVVGDGGFAGYLVQKRELHDGTTVTAFWTTVALGTVLAVGLALLAGPLSRALDVPELGSVLPALAFALFVSGFSIVPAALLNRELRFKELALRQIVANVPSVVVAVVMALAGFGVWALVAQTVVRNLISVSMLWRATDFRPRWTYDRTEVRAMTTFGAKSLFISLQNQLRFQGVVLLIGSIAGVVTLGYWTIAGRLVYVVVDVFSAVVGSVAHPVFARLQDAPERLARALDTARTMSALILVPGLVLLALVSADVVPAVFGDQWAPTTTVASILALSSVLQQITAFDRSVLIATGHPGTELVLTTVVIAVQLGLAAVYADDLVALAIGMTVSNALAVPARLLVVRRLLGVPLAAFRSTASVLLAGGLLAGAVIGVQALTGLEDVAYVAMAVVVGGLVYVAALALVARPVLVQALDLGRSVLSRRRP